jgi:hypothetical protein
MVNPTEALELDLPRLAHGLIRLSDTEDTKWCLATSDVEFFGEVLAADRAKDFDLLNVVLHTGGATWRLLLGWPEPHVGIDPIQITPERD